MNKNEIQAGTTAQKCTAADLSTSASLEQNGVLSAALSVEEGNKLIAEFIGWRFIKWCGGEDELKIPMYQRFENDELVHPGIFNKPQFHDSWNSLMPVVEKIKELEFEVNTFSDYTKTEKYRNEVRISELGKNEHCRIFIQRTNAIEALWFSVVEFIKWYNVNTAAVGSR